MNYSEESKRINIEQQKKEEKKSLAFITLLPTSHSIHTAEDLRHTGSLNSVKIDWREKEEASLSEPRSLATRKGGEACVGNCAPWNRSR